MTQVQTQLSREQRASKLLSSVIKAIVDTIESEGVNGVPGGVLYAGVMRYGMTLNTFQMIMEFLESRGRLTRSGDLYLPAKRA